MSRGQDVVNEAIKDLGYSEDGDNNTKFGAWYGLNYQPWCAMAVSYWLDKAGVSTDIVKPFASSTAGYRWFEARGQARDRNYAPSPGDIIFIVWNKGEATPDHTALVEYCENGIVHTIEGNRSNTTKRCQYQIGDWQIYGYGVPAYSDERVESTVDENEFEEGEFEEMKVYQNGSTPEPIYADTNLTKKIGELNKYERCDCLGIFQNRPMVRYKIDNQQNYKIGFAKWTGGVK